MVTMNDCIVSAQLASECTGNEYTVLAYPGLYYILLKDGKDVWLPRNDLEHIYLYLKTLLLPKPSQQSKKPINTPLVQMHTSFDINTIPFNNLSLDQLININIKVQEKIKEKSKSVKLQSQTLVNKKVVSSTNKKSPVTKYMLPLKYKDLSFKHLEVHISTLLGQRVVVLSTYTQNDKLVVNYSLEGDIRNDDYS